MRHVLLGLAAEAPAQAATALAQRLGCEFERRESHYLGDYWLAKAGSMTVKVVAQPDAYGDPVEADFASYRTLVYVHGDWDDVPPALEGIRVGAEVLTQLRAT